MYLRRKRCWHTGYQLGPRYVVPVDDVATEPAAFRRMEIREMYPDEAQYLQAQGELPDTTAIVSVAAQLKRQRDLENDNEVRKLIHV